MLAVAVAPADVHLLSAGKDAAVPKVADRLAAELTTAGCTVLYDDRPQASAGLKFADAHHLTETHSAVW